MHLASGPTNLYKKIAIALKGCEWRRPGLVAFATKLMESNMPHKSSVKFTVPSAYEPKTGPNPWASKVGGETPSRTDALLNVCRVATLAALQGGEEHAPGLVALANEFIALVDNAAVPDSSTEPEPEQDSDWGASTSMSLPANQRASNIISGEVSHLEEPSHKYDARQERDVSVPPTRRSAQRVQPKATGAMRMSAATEMQRIARSKLARLHAGDPAWIPTAMKLPAPERPRDAAGLQSPLQTNKAAEKEVAQAGVLGRVRGKSLLEEASVVFSAMLRRRSRAPQATAERPSTQSPRATLPPGLFTSHRSRSARDDDSLGQLVDTFEISRLSEFEA